MSETNCDGRIEMISYDFILTRRDCGVVQFNLRRNPAFLLDDYPSPSAV
jgi:hypothetical protein